MTAPTQTVLDSLRVHEPELRALGVHRLALFGSRARRRRRRLQRRSRRPARPRLLALRLRPLEELRRRLAAIVGRDVDLIEEPVRRGRLRREIEAARVHAF